MEPINTVVHGIPDSCRATADMLGKVKSGVHDVGTGIYRTRSESETCWEGKAGDAFREAISKKGKLSDDLSEAASRAQAALNEFAGKLQTVRAKIQQARDVAQSHGLTVTPTAIQPPGPAPEQPSEQGGPPGMDGGKAFLDYTEAKAAYDKQVRGYKEAKATVEQARTKERAAHQALKSAMDYEAGLLESLKKGLSWTLVGANHGLLTQPQMSADTFQAKANSFYEKAAKTGQAADDPALTAAQRSAHLDQQNKFTKKAGQAETQAAKSQKVADRVNSRVKVGPDSARLLGKTAKKIPVVGTGITMGVQAEAVINDGKPVGKAAANVAGGTLGGIAAGAAIGGMVGGPVGVVVGVGVSAIGSGIGSWLGEETYDAVTEEGN